jgi:Domain of unknown function (DUF4337)
MRMNVEELNENTEHARHSGQKAIGLTTAIVAVLLAVATSLSHRAHTEEIKLQTKVNDGWSFYQAKHNRAHEYGKYAENEALANQKEVALKDLKVSILEECGAPAEENCTSPVVKDSAALKQLIKDSRGAEGGEHAQTPEGPPRAYPARVHDGASGQKNLGSEVPPKKEGAVNIQERTRDLEKETELTAKRADRYDSAELFLEVSIVLCSIALLAEARLYWRLSFLSTAIGVGIAVSGYMLH